mgnify:CR=1 FL=1
MNSFASVVNSLVDEQMMNLSTAFIGKVISFNIENRTATVQPLTKTKAFGKKAKDQAVLSNIPVLNNAQYKLTFRYISCEGFAGGFFAEREYMKAGDLCVCVVSDRDITEARKGNSAVPARGHHEIRNAMVIGCL